MNQIAGIQTFLQNLPLVRIGGNVSRSVYQYTLQGPDVGELYRVAADFERRVRTLPGLTDVNSDLRISNPELIVDIDRDRASAMGADVDAIEGALFSAYGPRQVSSIYTATDTYWVILELLPKFAHDPQSLELLHVRADSGKLVRLSSMAALKSEVGPFSVAHLGQLPAVTVSFDLLPGVSLGEAVDSVEQLAQEVLPPRVRTNFQGLAAAYQSSLTGMGLLLVMAILVIYMVLGILYESFLHPITILSGLPSAGLGALATLLLFHDEMNIYSFVGIIMLIGTLPIALGFGAGGEVRRSLGLAVGGGLLVSQFLTLYITPVFYLMLERRGKPVSTSKPVEELVGQTV